METITPERDRRQVVYAWLEEEVRNYYGGLGRVNLLKELEEEAMREATELFAVGQDEAAIAKRALAQDYKRRYYAQHKAWMAVIHPDEGDRIQLKRAYDRLREIGMLIEEDDTPEGRRDTER